MTQEFLIRVATDRKITSNELLRAALSIDPLPKDVQAIDCGDVENAPDVYADALKRYAEKHGLKLVQQLECPSCKQTGEFYQHGIATYRCVKCSHIFVRTASQPEEVPCS